MKTLTIAAVAMLAASLALADASVQQKTQVHFSGAMGSVINAFGRGATHEGLTSETAVHHNRKSSRTGDIGEIVDLDEEKVYHLDYGRKTYTVVTFDELRKQYEQARERAEKRESPRGEKKEGPEYEVDFSTTSPGKRLEINGWDTHEEIVTVTVHEKGKKIERSGGFLLTADLWMGPRLAAMRELADFDLRFMHKVYGEGLTADMRQMTAMMAATPAFGKAMKAFADKRSHFEGTPIRTKLTFETVTGTDPQAKEQQPESPGSALGGLMGRMHRRREGEGAERNALFESNGEILKASGSASAADVAIPAGFKER